MMMRRFLLTLAGTLFSLSASARAAIVISGDVATVGAQCTLTVTQDITWTASVPAYLSPANYFAIVFDNWLDPSPLRGFSLDHDMKLNFVVDGKSAIGGGGLLDERGEALGSIGANDGYISVLLSYYPTSTTFTSGSQITLKAGTYQFESIGLNPAIEQPFTGATFLTSNEGVLLSNVVAAPEASSCMMAAAAAGAFLARRRRDR